MTRRLKQASRRTCQPPASETVERTAEAMGRMLGRFHRRALGAKRRDIIEQFLIETAVMSGSGGIIGVALGLAFPPLVASVWGIPVVVSPWSPVVAFLIAVLTGIVFGVYPARRAALLDPVEALRAE